MSLAPNAALVIIDVQQGLDDPALGERNNPNAEQRMAELLAAWRSASRPIAHVQHMSVSPASRLRPELPGNAIKPQVAPIAGERLFRKNVNSAFVGTGLETYLRDNDIHELVMLGLTTDHCVSSSARMASDLGFIVTIVEDATAAFERFGPDGTHYSAATIHGAELAMLHGEFVTVRASSEILAELGG